MAVARSFPIDGTPQIQAFQDSRDREIEEVPCKRLDDALLFLLRSETINVFGDRFALPDYVGDAHFAPFR